MTEKMMILLDYNQIALSNIIVQKLNDEQMIRHMILNSIRMYNKKYRDEYGQMVICADGMNTWRKEYYPQYKANRRKHRDNSDLDWTEIFRILHLVRDEIKENLQQYFIAGLKLNLVNPKMWLFYLTIFPVFISNEIDVLNKLIFLGLLTVLINLFADISYAYLSNFFFQSSSIKTKQLINKISGITLIGLGLYIAISRLS